MKLWDKIIVAVLLVVAFGSAAFILINNQKTYAKTEVEIKVEGKLVKRVHLDTVTGTQQIPIQNKYGKNIIQIKDGSVSIIDADCPDKICVKDGSIHKPGQVLVCLPHKLIIEIKGNNNSETDDVAF